MRRPAIRIASALALAFLIGHSPLLAELRQAHVAGTFYPKDGQELFSVIGGLFEQAPAPQRPDKPRILISPHAGYAFSGPVAANAFRLLRGHTYDAVVVVGFTHRESFAGSSVDVRAGYETPLGIVPVDLEATRQLLESGASQNGGAPVLSTLEAPHASSEHSLEVMLPFLQAALGSFKLIPIMMGEPSAAHAQALAEALAQLARKGDYLFVFSSDLSHYRPYDDARRVDERTVNALLFETPQAVDRLFTQRQLEACGRGPLMTALFLSDKLGYLDRTLVRYANSGDTTGRRDSVVGYAALVFYERPSDQQQVGGIAPEAGQALVALARRTLERSIGKKELPDAVASEHPDLKRTNGVFVTLWKGGELRGCIGRIDAGDPLSTSVPIVALDAALRDPRFSPLQPDELSQIRVEVSVLTQPQHLPDLQALVPGRDGVVMRAGEKRGVFLPSVWESTGWTRIEFMRELASQKTGIPADDWASADLFTFRDQVFAEP